MLVGLTNCKKEKDPTVKTYVGTVDASYVVKDADIKISKGLAKEQLINRTWIMDAIQSPFYSGQPYAVVKGNEFINGSAAQQWWAADGNNPVTFSASQAVYSNLTPAEPVRLIMEGYGPDNTKPAYLGILDFDPTQAQFPLAITSKSLGDILTVNANGLTTLPGGNLISVSVTLQVAPVNLQATETTSLLSFGPNEGQATGVTGSLDFQNIVYGPSTLTSQIPVGTGDCVVFDQIASKIFGITLTITFAPSSSAPGVPGSVKTITVPAAGPGQALRLVLKTDKLGWYDSATIGVSDTDITVQSQTVSIDN